MRYGGSVIGAASDGQSPHNASESPWMMVMPSVILQVATQGLPSVVSVDAIRQACGGMKRCQRGGDRPGFAVGPRWHLNGSGRIKPSGQGRFKSGADRLCEQGRPTRQQPVNNKSSAVRRPKSLLKPRPVFFNNPAESVALLTACCPQIADVLLV